MEENGMILMEPLILKIKVLGRGNRKLIRNHPVKNLLVASLYHSLLY